MNGSSRFAPWFVVGFALVYLGAMMASSARGQGEFDIDEFARLPVLDGGRIKPIDTVARVSLMIISNRQTFTDENGRTQPAIRWLLDVFSQRVPAPSKDGLPAAFHHKVFRIENDQVLNVLELKPRPGSYRYSFAEIGPKLSVVRDQEQLARRQDAQHRNLYQEKIIELARHLHLFLTLSKTLEPSMVPPEREGGSWRPLADALDDPNPNPKASPVARALHSMLDFYAHGDAASFNRYLAAYRGWLVDRVEDHARLAGFEVFFNHFAPFYHCSLLYVFVFVLACVSWVAFTQPLRRAAFWLAVLTFAVHTWAICARMYIQGRPPVTNLYSSAVFIGWGCLGLCLILEAIYKLGIASAVAAVTGALTMLVAHHLAASGDTLEMLQAVLDTNFWLATHVTTVTLGYTATFVAGFIGIKYILLGVLTSWLTAELQKAMTQMMYGVICFAMLLSFVGTVLGGIWADQSWGRFWGWDPKENGAVLIVIWNALILHARWGGMIKQRGLALLCVAGNMVTGWSWFGTNQLGVGLHAYGFNNQLALGLVVFWSFNLLIIALGLVPISAWRSYNVRPSTKSDASAPDKAQIRWA
jgi:ABC-type transport system involved in cytochrome c biogenesis permease subunit